MSKYTYQHPFQIFIYYSHFYTYHAHIKITAIPNILYTIITEENIGNVEVSTLPNINSTRANNMIDKPIYMPNRNQVYPKSLPFGTLFDLL